jgi:hypothetical protein
MLHITIEKQFLHHELGARELSDAVNYIRKRILHRELGVQELSDAANYNRKTIPAPQTRGSGTLRCCKLQ